MKRLLSFFIFVLLIFSPIFGQQKLIDVIYLKNGEKYIGEVLLKTSEMLMLKTSDGKRYQFQLKEIEKTEEQFPDKEQNNNTNKIKEDNIINIPKGNFAGLVDINGGIASAQNTSLSGLKMIQTSLAFGSRNAFGTKSFVGIGVGYELIINKVSAHNLSYVPVFIQLSSFLNENKLSPVIGTKLGYAFAMNESYKGGVMLQLTGGTRYRISGKSAFCFGLFGQIQQIKGTIIEHNELGTFSTIGKTFLHSFGLNASLLF